VHKGLAVLFSLLISVIILLALIIPPVPASAERSKVNLLLLPAAQNVGLGDTFIVTVQAQCGTQTIDGMEIYLDFDPACLEVQSATAGSALPMVFKPLVFNNDRGKIDYSAGKMSEPFPSGAFNVLSIVFLAKNINSIPAHVSFHTASDRMSIVDMYGEDVTGILSGGTYTIYDKTPPSVTAVSPAVGQKGVAVSSAIVLTFSKSMNQTTTREAFHLSPPVTGNYSWNSQGSEMTFTPAASLGYSTTYTIGLSTTARDTYDVFMVVPFSSTFTTQKGLTSITVTPSNSAIAKGRTQQFTATPNYSDGTHSPVPDITWSSSDSTKVTIDNAGLAAAMDITTSPVTIRATSGTINGATAISVKAAELTFITLNPANTIVARGHIQLFTADGIYTDNNTGNVTALVEWRSSDTSKVTISDNGLATALEVTDSPVIISGTCGTISETATMTVIPAADMTITPSIDTVMAGENFTVTIEAQCGLHPLSEINVYLDFDPAYLEVISATVGPVLSPVSGQPEWNNTAGTFAISAGGLSPDSTRGTFPVAIITFLAKTSTNTATDISFHTLAPGGTRIYYGDIDITGALTRASVQIIRSAQVTFGMSLQGGSRPGFGWIVPVTVRLFTPGTTDFADILSAIPVLTRNLTTTKSGMAATIFARGVPPGTYDISLVSPHCLINVIRGAVITAPEITINSGTLLEGDANEDSKINIQDFGLLAQAYGKMMGNAGYDSRVDFDRNGMINIADFGLLSMNYGKESPQTILIP
jgi:hypothetical protein